MEIKRFSEYTNDEQKQLLMHWWHYYGKLPVTLAEIEEFMEILPQIVEIMCDENEVIRKESNSLFNAIITKYDQAIEYIFEILYL